ncbi:MAG: hypothetical protein WBG57_09985, partial [Ornithinimicrobium sp.]
PKCLDTSVGPGVGGRAEPDLAEVTPPTQLDALMPPHLPRGERLTEPVIRSPTADPYADYVQDDGVIVAVEGPSAAGKTTWCRRQASAFVEEYAPTGVEPDGADASAQAAYWVGVNSNRWRRAIDLEARSGTAICDSDPLKLHYSWCLARVGAAPWSRFEHEFAQARDAFARGSLGFADLVLISIPAKATLQAQCDADTTRRRKTFAIHSALAEPLRSWYQAVETLEPGRVVWDLPPNGLPQSIPWPRAQRSDPALLDQLLHLLTPH